MNIGDIVSNHFAKTNHRLGVILEIRKSIYVQDDECVKWFFPDIAKVLYSNGDIEYNPVQVYNRIN